MEIKYNGAEIIRKYKGVEIRRVVTSYFGVKEIHYTIGALVFLKLKEAKAYIDRVATNKAE